MTKPQHKPTKRPRLQLHTHDDYNPDDPEDHPIYALGCPSCGDFDSVINASSSPYQESIDIYARANVSPPVAILAVALPAGQVIDLLCTSCGAAVDPPKEVIVHNCAEPAPKEIAIMEKPSELKLTEEAAAAMFGSKLFPCTQAVRCLERRAWRGKEGEADAAHEYQLAQRVKQGLGLAPPATIDVKCPTCSAVPGEDCTEGGPGTGTPMRQVPLHTARVAQELT